MDKALQMISQHAEDGAKLRRDFFAVHGGKVAEAAGAWPSPWREGKILLAGNGRERGGCPALGRGVRQPVPDGPPPLPAIALTTDSSVLTSIGNDFGYDLVFTKQVQALGRPGDVFVGISTSGQQRQRHRRVAGGPQAKPVHHRPDRGRGRAHGSVVRHPACGGASVHAARAGDARRHRAYALRADGLLSFRKCDGHQAHA